MSSVSETNHKGQIFLAEVDVMSASVVDDTPVQLFQKTVTVTSGYITMNHIASCGNTFVIIASPQLNTYIDNTYIEIPIWSSDKIKVA